MIYKSPSINGEVVIKAREAFIGEGRTLIERLENKIRQDNEILKALEAEISEKRKNLLNVEEYVRKEAEEKARSIVDEALKKQDEIKDKGYKEGFAQGIEEGKRKGETEITRIIASMKGILSSLNSLYDSSLKKMDENIVLELSFSIAKKIVKDEVSIKKDVVLKNIKEALKKAQNSKIKLLLNPDDTEIAKGFLKEADIVSSSSIEPGGCKIYFDFGIIDATIDNQLKTIKNEYPKP
ncbi:MAG: FliH/SctL family protein [bacterium]